MHVMRGQVHHVVDRETNNDDHSDGLTDTQLPATQNHDCNDRCNDKYDCNDRINRDKQVSCRDEQNTERTDGRYGGTDHDTIKEGLLTLHPSPEDISLLVDSLKTFRRVILLEVFDVLVPSFPQWKLFSS